VRYDAQAVAEVGRRLEAGETVTVDLKHYCHILTYTGRLPAPQCPTGMVIEPAVLEP
jgi:hypothetical protein